MEAAARIDSAGLNLEERIIDIWRCAVVVKGGRRFSFAAMAVVGNGSGVVGVGYGKAREVPGAIEKAVKDAKKRLIYICTYGTTIPHEVRGNYGTAQVVMLPALPGTGIIAGAAVRAVLESIGVRDILTKSVGGSNNAKNLVRATIEGLLRLRSREQVGQLRGVAIPEDAVLAQSLKVHAQPPRREPPPDADRPRGRRGRPGTGPGGTDAVPPPAEYASASPDTPGPTDEKKA